ncbi:helix-turn-helix transcriptional regulator [Shewanella sp. SM87]|nr:helix-turn-helix transcriptional regulator [Shewanella sp. SM87]MCU8009345.1 helix-turn-helix transcriptional regulator [Shewanella sp. SM87]
MAIEALVNPDVLSWARLRSGYSESVLARKISVNVDKVLSWERGQKKPTFKQAQNIARVTNTPFGFLFLPNPPRENLPIPDLRTVDGVQMQEPSTELRDILLQALSKQAWYKDFLISHNSKPLDFIGSFTIKSNIDEVVQSIRNTIGVSFPVTGTWNDYQRELIHGAESAGVMVM